MSCSARKHLRVHRNFDARHRSRRERVPVIVIYIAETPGSPFETRGWFALVIAKITEKGYGRKRRRKGEEAFAADDDELPRNKPPPSPFLK